MVFGEVSSSSLEIAEMRRLRKMTASVLLALLFSSQTLVAQDKARPCPELTEMKDSKFRPGQVWQYKTRLQEEGSTLTILKVESSPKMGTIIHIRVEKIRLRNCTGGPEPDKFEHMPFTREAIEHSVTKLLKENSVPDFHAGYDEWRNACGGVYTITVAEAIQVGEVTFRKNLGCGREG
jgi:hypothetical protein